MRTPRRPREHGVAGLVLAAALSAAACAPSEPGPPASSLRADHGERVHGDARVGQGERPELIVLIVVDQLPQYLFARYDTLFSGGFGRLLRDGRVYTRGSHDHSSTTTAPGHATIATGVYPRNHGIVANSWREWTDDRWVSVENFQDSTESVLGRPGLPGFSPRKLDATGLADWLVAADRDARIVSISGKYRGAVPLAGRVDAHVYVFDDKYGPGFTTSTFYRPELPGWLRRFNEERLAVLLADSVWESTVPESARGASRPDTVVYEHGGVHVAFPHRFVEEANSGDADDAAAFYTWWEETPMLDEAAVELAMDAVAALQLGQREATDLLALALSSTDRVGHAFGPFSREQLDNLLRLDRALGDLFAFLDRTVGTGNYVVALSSDHGVLPAPEYRQELGEEGGRVAPAQVEEMVQAIDSVSAASETERNTRRAAVLEEFDLVADAMTREELLSSDPGDTLLTLYRRCYRRDRPTGFGDRGVNVRLREGYMTGNNTATHGSPYAYDRRVPIVFMGAGVKAGRSDERVATVDIAPTLARLAGVPFPDTLDGRVLVCDGC